MSAIESFHCIYYQAKLYLDTMESIEAHYIQGYVYTIICLHVANLTDPLRISLPTKSLTLGTCAGGVITVLVVCVLQVYMLLNVFRQLNGHTDWLYAKVRRLSTQISLLFQKLECFSLIFCLASCSELACSFTSRDDYHHSTTIYNA